MKRVIIHISDLHVTTFQENDGTLNPDVQSYLTTNSDKDASNHFISQFINVIKKDFPNDVQFTLVITGDISNKAENNEFEFAGEFLISIISELSIPKERILLLPGDHDVHRRSIENQLADHPTSAPHQLHSIKFGNFSKLYRKIKGTEFPSEKLIIDTIELDEVILIGINSNYKINHKGGIGYLPITDFKKEFEDLKSKIGFSNRNIIVCWHHNIAAGFENKNSGQWDSENRRLLIAELESNGIKLVLTGNEHTDHARTVLSDSIMTSDCGSFTSLKFDASFKVYPLMIDEKTKILENKSYGLQKTHGNDKDYYWNIRPSKYSGQPSKFVLFKKNDELFNEEDIYNLPVNINKQSNGSTIEVGVTNLSNSHLANSDISEYDLKVQERFFFDNKEISDKLYAVIKEKGLFHSGHFHWSETSRAHNWIDVAKMLEDYESMRLAQDAIINVIETFELDTGCDLIIGLGYEGNILSTKPSILYNIPYSSLPYSYRYNDHHDYEKKLNFDNTDGNFKKIMIITDVVNDGRTIRKLIGKREVEFFKNVDSIVVVSLFYTGTQEINYDILNYNKLPKEYDVENDHAVNNIDFFTVKCLRVEKCPYGKHYKTECFIYRDELSCVHLFYDENS